jgi:hypothetical protein
MCTHHGHWESGGATIGKTIFKCVHIEKKKLFSPEPTNRPISLKLRKNHFCVKIINKMSKCVKWEIITKCKKWDEVIQKFSPREPLSQNSLD